MKATTAVILSLSAFLFGVYAVTHQTVFLVQALISAGLFVGSFMLWRYAIAQNAKFVVLTLLAVARDVGLPGMAAGDLFRASGGRLKEKPHLLLMHLEDEGLVSSEFVTHAPAYVGIKLLQYSVTDVGYDRWQRLLISGRWWSR